MGQWIFQGFVVSKWSVHSPLTATKHFAPHNCHSLDIFSFWRPSSRWLWCRENLSRSSTKPLLMSLKIPFACHCGSHVEIQPVVTSTCMHLSTAFLLHIYFLYMYMYVHVCTFLIENLEGESTQLTTTLVMYLLSPTASSQLHCSWPHCYVKPHNSLSS